MVRRFTLTELLITIVILVILLSVGMKGIRETRSATLARMGTLEMKQAVQKGYQFALFNEVPSVIQITKEDLGAEKGAIQATQGFAMNGYFTLDNGILDSGATPGFFTNNAREKLGSLQAFDNNGDPDLGALVNMGAGSESAITSGLTGQALNLAFDDGNTSDDSIRTSFNLSPAGGPVHIDMWVYNIDKPDNDPNNDGVGHGTIFSVDGFEARVEGGRLNFWAVKQESAHAEPMAPEEGEEWITQTSKVWKWWWTDIDPSVTQWNKLGVTFTTDDMLISWNGNPVEPENQELDVLQGYKRRYDYLPGGNVWSAEYEFSSNPGYPNTNKPLTFPRQSVQSAGNNLEYGVVDNIGTYDLASGPVVMNDMRGGYYELLDEGFQEIDNVTIVLNPRGEVVSPNYTFLRYVHANGAPTPLLEISGAWAGSSWLTELYDGNTSITVPYTADPGADVSMVLSTGTFSAYCTHGWQCSLNYDKWPTRSPEMISYRNLAFNEGAGTMTFDIINRNDNNGYLTKSGLTHLEQKHNIAQHNTGHTLNLNVSYFQIEQEDTKSFVEFRQNTKPKW